jgi:hypothetical protein
MSIFTGSELELLTGLNKSWWRLYWKEFSRLRRIEAAVARNVAADTPAFDDCEEDLACALRRRSATNAAPTVLQRRVELAAGNR